MVKYVLVLIEKILKRQKLLTWHMIQVRGDTVGELETMESDIEKDLSEVADKLTLGSEGL